MVKRNPDLIPMPKPEQRHDEFGVTYVWPDYALTAIVENFSSKNAELKADLEIWHKNGNGEALLHNSSFNVLSMTQQNNLRAQLNYHNPKDGPEIDWHGLVSQICFYSKQYFRENHAAEIIDGEPKNLTLQYLLKPLLEKGKATVICAPGGTAKSWIAAICHVVLESNTAALGGRWQPTDKCIGLYLDWESDYDTYNKRVRAIRKGMGLNGNVKMHYRRCYAPLAQDIDYIRRYVMANNIEFVIVDSQMAALGDNPNDAEPNDKFFNALRTLDCSVLILDHVSKEEMGKIGGHATPYGSVVKWNRARSIFALKKHQLPGEDFIQLTLNHTKHNDGKLYRPVGIQIDFVNTAIAEPESVSIKYIDPTELGGELSNDAPPADKIYHLLTTQPDHLDFSGETVRGWAVTEIAKELGINYNTVRSYVTDRQADRYTVVGERVKPFRYVGMMQ